MEILEGLVKTLKWHLRLAFGLTNQSFRRLVFLVHFCHLDFYFLATRSCRVGNSYKILRYEILTGFLPVGPNSKFLSDQSPLRGLNQLENDSTKICLFFIFNIKKRFSKKMDDSSQLILSLRNYFYRSDTYHYVLRVLKTSQVSDLYS